jgi:peptide/nickel transport system permease protein
MDYLESQMETSARIQNQKRVGVSRRLVSAPTLIKRLRSVNVVWHGRLIVGSTIILGVILMAVLAPWLSPHEPNHVNLRDRLMPPSWTSSGSATHPLGTDQLGRDLLTRILYGARVSLLVGAFSILTSAIIGVVLGLVAGYYSAWIGNLIMRITDVQMSLPFMLLALLVASLLGPSLRNIVIVFALTGWYIYARIARASTLSLREKEWVEAARAVGATDLRILRYHVFPHLLSPILVMASFDMSRVIVAEAALGFLGLGVPPPHPSWGNMLSDGRQFIQDAWWISTLPGLALAILVLGINTLGDALRDILDPRLRRYLKGPPQIH